jgi:hypothetical protein
MESIDRRCNTFAISSEACLRQCLSSSQPSSEAGGQLLMAQSQIIDDSASPVPLTSQISGRARIQLTGPRKLLDEADRVG